MFHDEGHGYDLFGMRLAAVRRAARATAPLYDRYFRVSSVGADHVPRDGRAILVANHSGALPVDAAMLCMPRKSGRPAFAIAYICRENRIRSPIFGWPPPTRRQSCASASCEPPTGLISVGVMPRVKR